MKRYATPDNCTKYSNKPTGKDFETSVINVLKRTFKDSKTFEIKDLRGTKEDIQNGTDFTCGEIRIDLTMNIDHKDNMVFIKETDLDPVCGFPIKMGIRKGNNHNGKTHEFNEPVVVIGLNMPPALYDQYEDDIKIYMQKHSEELMCKADDYLAEYEEMIETQNKSIDRYTNTITDNHTTNKKPINITQLINNTKNIAPDIKKSMSEQPPLKISKNSTIMNEITDTIETEKGAALQYG